ncbi:MAG TPA: hypothetical protein VGA13_04325 [Acidimicrobiales bacterium]|jgi:hypothetical protein
MGRGSRKTTRWKNDRKRAKKHRELRQREEKFRVRRAAQSSS